MYLEISSAPMQDNKGRWTIGYHAGRICGDGQYGYVIFGESSMEILKAKLDSMGYKYN